MIIAAASRGTDLGSGWGSPGGWIVVSARARKRWGFGFGTGPRSERGSPFLARPPPSHVSAKKYPNERPEIHMLVLMLVPFASGYYSTTTMTASNRWGRETGWFPPDYPIHKELLRIPALSTHHSIPLIIPPR